MPEALTDAVEVFAAPLESMIVAVAKGVSDAQRALDHNSLATQAAIDADPAVAGLGLQATWYQFPRVDAQFKVSMTVTQTKDAVAPTRFYFSPVSAAFQNHFNYAADASSQISFAIVPVPPPNAAAAPSGHLTVDVVRAAALAAPGAKFAVVDDPQLGKIPDPKLRFEVNFSATSGTWSVIQYNPLDSARRPVVVVVDDRTKAVRVLATP